MVQKNDYSKEVLEKVVNSLKEVKRVTRDNFMSKSSATFSKFYKPTLKEITDVLIKYNEIDRSYTTHPNLWFDDGELGATPYFIIRVCNSHYKEVEVSSYRTWENKVKEACASEIADVLNNMVHLIENEIEKAKSFPKAEEMDETFLSMLQKYVNGSADYKVAIEEGKLAKEMCRDYTAFVVRYKKDDNYKCCFRFYNDQLGNVVINGKDAYYGEYFGHFTMDEVEEGIKDYLKIYRVI